MGSLSFVVDLSKLIIHQSDSVRYSFCKKVVKWCISIKHIFINARKKAYSVEICRKIDYY